MSRLLAKYRRARKAAWWPGSKRRTVGRVVVAKLYYDPAGDPTGPPGGAVSKDPA